MKYRNTKVTFEIDGITFSTIPVTFFYLIPRRINNRHYVNIILIGLILIAAFSIIVSFFMDYKAYVTIFSSHFQDFQNFEESLGCSQLVYSY